MANLPIHLHRLILDHYGLEELRTLCFHLEIEYDDLPGEGRQAKARELVVHLERHNRIPELIATGKQSRPDISWDDAYLEDRLDQLRARRDQADKVRREMRERQRVVNLRPLDVTHTFKDRLREIHTLCDHLADANVRLVSIVGRGGMGKTALASRVLADLERGVLPVPGEERELTIDGILYLSGRSTGLGLERVYADVGRMLGQAAASRLAALWASRDMSLAAKIESLLETMQDGLYLILLDNLEDELTEEGEIAEDGLRLFVDRCLTQPGGVRLIVTSREYVKIANTALRNARSVQLREGLPKDEAVTLLREMDPDETLGLQGAPEETLRRAARLTQGIPRALEILAGILREDPAASPARLLDDEDLFGEQVVERLVAQGYQRVGESERRVMEALAVFDQPVEDTAVAYLLHPWFPSMDVRSSLRRLVGGYFVSANRVTGEYSLHPLDREFAYRQLLEEIEVEKGYNRRNLELRAADFYASIRKQESEWKSIEDLTPQLAEFEHRVRAGDCDNASQVLKSISDNLSRWGHYARLSELRESLLDQNLGPALQADNLADLGFTYYVLGKFKQAIEYYKEAIVIAQEIGNRSSEIMVLGRMGRALRALGQVEQAIQAHQRSLSIARELGDCQQEERQLSHLGSAYRYIGQIKRAISLYEQALDLACSLDNFEGQGMHLGRLGLSYNYLGDFRQALEFDGEALNIFREMNNRRQESIELDHVGYAYYGLGDAEKSIRFYEQALTITREIGYRRGESRHLMRLGKAWLTIGEPSVAQRFCEESLALGILDINYQAALTLGIALLHQPVPYQEAFVDAVAYCQDMLTKAEQVFEPRYVLASALVGRAACDPRWDNENQRLELLAPALEEYRRSLKITSAPGIVQYTLRDLELIRAAGIKGLEPVFELLETALKIARGAY